MSDNEIEIWCSVVGAGDMSTPFRIHASNRSVIEDLKEKIYDKAKGRFPGIGPADLVLWKITAPTLNFTPPEDDDAKLSEIASELKNPMANVSSIGLRSDTARVQLLVQTASYARDLPLGPMDPRKRARLSSDGMLHFRRPASSQGEHYPDGEIPEYEEWAMEVWSARWGQEIGITLTKGHLNMPTGVWSRSPVLIRKEYEGIWSYIEEQLAGGGRTEGGLVVWGQPGIGKSYFLQFALAKALAIKHPVVLCNQENLFYLFTERAGRRVRIGDFNDRLPKNTLVLCDSREGITSPPMHFTEPMSTAFVVQATSPRISRWKEWSKQRNAQIWTMDLWSEEEIAAASEIRPIIVPTGCYSPLDLFHIWGPSARQCFRSFGPGATPYRNSGNPAHDFPALPKPASLLTDSNIDDFVAAFSEGDIPEGMQSKDFHAIFFARKLSTSNPLEIPQFVYEIPTDFLRQSFAVELARKSLRAQITYAAKFMPYPQVFGIFYEPVVVARLSLIHDPLACHLVNGSRFALPSPLRVWRDTVPFSAEFTAPEIDTLYIPPVRFPSIDAVAITNKGRRVTMLQMTIASTHDIKPQGVTKVITSLAKMATKDVEWAFIFVTTSSERGEALCLNKVIKPPKATRGGPSFVMGEIHAGWAVVECEDAKLRDVVAAHEE